MAYEAHFQNILFHYQWEKNDHVHKCVNISVAITKTWL